MALKIPHPEALVTARLRERFVKEAEAAASLDHPNVVPVYEAGIDGVVSYIAYAYVAGQTLQDWLSTHDSSTDYRLIAAIVRDIALGVQHAHHRGVLHRDIKPSNIMIAFKEVANPETLEDSPHTIRITDFGMARVEADDVEATRTGTILGTPAYMAPEQSRGATSVIGPAADVYSIGLCFTNYSLVAHLSRLTMSLICCRRFDGEHQHHRLGSATGYLKTLKCSRCDV